MVDRSRTPAMSFAGLDILRLVAALLVAAYHLGWKRQADDPSFVLAWSPAFSAGWVGVEIFFVLSGFVIAYSSQGRTTGQFLRSRALRLFPAAWLCATITLVLAGGTAAQYLGSITLFPYGPWIDNSYWTLPIEMVFYALVGLALAARWPLERVALFLGLYSTFFWAVKLLNRFYHFADLTVIENNAGYLLMLHFGVFFAAGMLLFARRHRLFTALFLAVGLVETWWRATGWHDPFPWLAPLLWAAAVLAIIVSIERRSLVDRWIDPRLARTLGLMTYPLYLLHQQVGLAVERLVADPLLAFLAAMAVVIALALAVLQGEKWVRHILTRRPLARSAIPSLP